MRLLRDCRKKEGNPQFGLLNLLLGRKVVSNFDSFVHEIHVGLNSLLYTFLVDCFDVINSIMLYQAILAHLSRRLIGELIV